MSLSMPGCVKLDFDKCDKDDIIDDLWSKYTDNEKLFSILYNFTLCLIENMPITLVNNSDIDIHAEAQDIQLILDDYLKERSK